MIKLSLPHDKKILITGVAGFIGSSLAQYLLERGCQVIGLDNINDYYDTSLKYNRLAKLQNFDNFVFILGDVADKIGIENCFLQYKPFVVIHLAAQAGVRYSVDHPDVYIYSNIVGTFNILEACRYYSVEHLVYASSSSVYGANEKVPFSEQDFVDRPVSLYAATKKSNELMAYAYSHLYKIPATGLRFFTVYGPWGRPDMAYFQFVQKYFRGEYISIFNNGDFQHDLYRDFTFIDDLIEGVARVCAAIPSVDETGAPHRILNIGNSRPEKLMTFITTLEKCLSKSLGRTVIFEKKYEPLKLGDVPATFADTELLNNIVGYKPTTSIEDGLQKFTDWFCEYYNVK